MIVIKAEVKTSLEKAWEFWNSPEHIIHWNFASDDWHCPKASNDLKVDGKLIATMASKDNQMSFDFSGTYLEIIPQKKIVYVLDDGRKVQIDFETKNDLVLITESFDPEQTHSLEMQEAGWQAILNNFKKYCENFNR